MSIVNKRYRVPLADNLRKSVTVDPKATEGAILGVNLFDASGNLYKISDIVNPPASDGTASGSDLSDNTTDDLQEGALNEYFTVERAQDAVGGSLVDSANIDFTYDDAGNTITADLTPLADAGGGTLLRIVRDMWGRITGTSAPTTTDLPEGSRLYYTDARADARITLQKGAASGLCPLDSGSLIPVAFLPPLAVISTFIVASQAAMLALTAQPGDIAVRTDLNETFILAADPASTLANWVQLLFPGSAVTSFNGRTGPVTPQPGDYVVSDITGAVASTRTLTAGTGLTGGGDLSADRTIALANTAVTPGPYGDATHVATFTVDAQGRLTLAGQTAITFPSGAVSSVFGRTGAVVAAANDYTFAQIGSKPTTYGGYGITDAQPLDATLTALAAANWAANALPIGSGADTVAQVSFAANTFPARASTGNLVATTITDFGLSLVDDANASAARTTIGLGNADNTSDVNKPVSTAQQAALDLKLATATPTGYIDGLKMVWNSATSISVTSGTCYIQGSSAVISFPSLLTLSGLSLSASTFYHLYGYLNSGTPAIELVTTAPATAYSGTARSKTGDTSRRYLGSVLTDASGNVNSFLHSNGKMLYVAGNSAGVFFVLSAGAATTSTAISLTGVVPVTATQATLRIANNSIVVNMTVQMSTTSGNFLSIPTSATSNGVPVTADCPIASQAMAYMCGGASGNANIGLLGYVFER